MTRDKSDESDDAITRDFRVYQRRTGHRYSLDDVLTAREALRAVDEAAAPRWLDLGCGLGSVLLMVAWKLPHATMVGIEAQEESFALARRNVERNGLAARTTLIHDDLRTARIEGPFNRITGTPPYMPPGTATPSPDPQRAHARIELRGGVEDYVAAAAHGLADDGVFVVCMDARAVHRAEQAASERAFSILRQCDAIPRDGQAALFSVLTMSRKQTAERERVQFVARTRDGVRTAEYIALRAFYGLTASEDP